MSRREKCRSPSDHDWRTAKTQDHEICTKCGTRFPCRNKDCGHWDCIIVRGEELPENAKKLMEALGVEVDVASLPKLKRP